MTEAKKMAGSTQTDPATEARANSKAVPKLELKWKRILRVMLDGNVNRFEAESHGDHCLNSTVSEIGRDHKVSIDWIWEEVLCMGGRATARVKRYWVARNAENMAHARSLLGESSQSLTATA